MRIALPLLLPCAAGLVFTGFIFAIIALPWPHEAAERALCDRQVAILLNTKDLVELQRAVFFVGWFNCNIGRRLPP